MDRFLENSDPEKKRRSNEIQAKLNWCRERIRQLTEAKVPLSFYLIGTRLTVTQQQHRPFDLALTETCDFLSRTR
jgi:hypothetical protein